MSNEDYSSGILVQLIVESFRAQNIAPPAIEETRQAGPIPKFPLSKKRRLLEPVYTDYGARPILQAGLDIRHLPSGPLSYALMKAPTVTDLLRRWRHLEKYFHSRHHIEMSAESESSVRFRHVSSTDHQPQIYESLLISGVLSGLLLRYGCQDVQLFIGKEDTARAAFHLGSLVEDFDPPADCAAFRISWSNILTKVRVADTIPPQKGQHSRMPGQGPYSKKITDLVWEDPLQRWQLPDIAKQVALSTRSLQRRLKEEGGSFSKCVLSARSLNAARHIADSDISLTAIGFLAGFADSAHFSREFKKNMGLTPSEFKSALSVDTVSR